jgi:hypothetical protein
MINFTISPVSKEQVENLRANLVAHQTVVNLDVIGDDEIDYHIDGHGISSIAHFKDSSLNVEVTKKPFYVTQGMIEGGIKEALGVVEKESK